MRLSSRVTILVVALVALAPTMDAQQAGDPALPPVGSWGAEAIVGNGLGANVLRMSSPTAAWLAGLSFNVTRQTEDVSGVAGGTRQTGWYGFADARLGRRWWSGDRGERVRPLTGLGVLGGVSGSGSIHSWSGGAYGELGASYFFSPHVSLGAASELAAVYTRERFANTGSERITTRWLLRGNLVRVNAGVYF